MEAKPKTQVPHPKPHAKKASGKNSIQIKVASPYKVYFNDVADSISAENTTGPFDILPGHHNFITLLRTCEIIIRTYHGEIRIRISGGIMHVKQDQVVVFLDV